MSRRHARLVAAHDGGWQVEDLGSRNGTVVDGTGAAAVRADVGIEDDRIAAVGELEGNAGITIDAAGRIVAPGFIDAHAHSDFALLRDPLNSEKVMQGVTTNIIGNCALSPAPVGSIGPSTWTPGTTIHSGSLTTIPLAPRVATTGALVCRRSASTAVCS